MEAPQFSHVALNCRDLLKMERFYSVHFKFRRARVVPLGEDRIVFLKLGQTYLELFNAGGSSPLPAAANDGNTFAGVRHIAFRVENVDAALAAMGGDARVTLGPLSFDEFIPGWRTAWLADPEGNIIEISQGYVDQPDPPPPPSGSETAWTHPAR